MATPGQAISGDLRARGAPAEPARPGPASPPTRGTSAPTRPRRPTAGAFPARKNGCHEAPPTRGRRRRLGRRRQREPGRRGQTGTPRPGAPSPGPGTCGVSRTSGWSRSWRRRVPALAIGRRPIASRRGARPGQPRITRAKCHRRDRLPSTRHRRRDQPAGRWWTERPRLRSGSTVVGRSRARAGVGGGTTAWPWRA
jgi:hypothetical protein